MVAKPNETQSDNERLRRAVVDWVLSQRDLSQADFIRRTGLHPIVRLQKWFHDNDRRYPNLSDLEVIEEKFDLPRGFFLVRAGYVEPDQSDPMVVVRTAVANESMRHSISLLLAEALKDQGGPKPRSQR